MMSPIMGAAYVDCVARTEGVIKGETYVFEGHEYEVTKDNNDGIVMGISKGSYRLITRAFDPQYLSVPSMGTNAIADKSKQSTLDHTDPQIGVVTMSKDYLVSLGMRPSDNAARCMIRLSHRLSGAAFESPYSTSVITSMSVAGDNTVKRTSVSSNLSDAVNFGPYLIKLSANGDILVAYSGSVTGLVASGECLQAWSLDITEFCQTP
jgi:hypothetical protein